MGVKFHQVVTIIVNADNYCQDLWRSQLLFECWKTKLIVLSEALMPLINLIIETTTELIFMKN